MNLDLNGLPFKSNPYDTYRSLLNLDVPISVPVEGSSSGMLLIVRYDDVGAILKEKSITKNSRGSVESSQSSQVDPNLLEIDPPDHTRLRSLVSKAFTPERITNLVPRIQKVVDELIDSLELQGGMEFMSQFALPLPAIVIAEMLGVPADDRHLFHRWSNEIITARDLANPRPEVYREASLSLGRYLSLLMEERRARPKDDLISTLVALLNTEETATEKELCSLCMLILIAGHETTVNMLGNGLYTLLRHPDQFVALKEHPRLVNSAVEEMLRFESPVQRATFRLTTRTIQLSTYKVEEGQQVSAVLGAANRDPSQFRDPDAFDIARQPNRHLAFGGGIHFCLGPALARLEGQIAFSKLLTRLPDIHLRENYPNWNFTTTALRGLNNLFVAF